MAGTSAPPSSVIRAAKRSRAAWKPTQGQLEYCRPDGRWSWVRLRSGFGACPGEAVAHSRTGPLGRRRAEVNFAQLSPGKRCSERRYPRSGCAA